MIYNNNINDLLPSCVFQALFRQSFFQYEPPWPQNTILHIWLHFCTRLFIPALVKFSSWMQQKQNDLCLFLMEILLRLLLCMQMLLSIIIVLAGSLWKQWLPLVDRICMRNNLNVSTCDVLVWIRKSRNWDFGWVKLHYCRIWSCYTVLLKPHDNETSLSQVSMKYCKCGQGCFSRCTFKSNGIKPADMRQGCLIGRCNNRSK